jgi:hypothetical protein
MDLLARWQLLHEGLRDLYWAQFSSDGKWVTYDGQDYQLGTFIERRCAELLDFKRDTREVAAHAERSGIDSTPLLEFVTLLEISGSNGATLGRTAEEWGKALAFVGRLELCDVGSVNKVEARRVSDRSKSGTRPSVAAQMHELLQRKPESRGWSAQEFATSLGCGKSTVVESETWKTLQKMRAEAELSRRSELE